jgi:hypothetical protein
MRFKDIYKRLKGRGKREIKYPFLENKKPFERVLTKSARILFYYITLKP